MPNALKASLERDDQFRVEKAIILAGQWEQTRDAKVQIVQQFGMHHDGRERIVKLTPRISKIEVCVPTASRDVPGQGIGTFQ